MTYKEYEERLAEIGVLVRARNFLVFQGDVKALARKALHEFLQLFEQISGSADFREDYEEARKEKEEADAATLYCYNKQKRMKGQRRALKVQKEEAERFDALLERKKTLKTEMFLWILHHMESRQKESEEKLKELRAELEENLKKENGLLEALKETKKMASSSRRAGALFWRRSTCGWRRGPHKSCHAWRCSHFQIRYHDGRYHRE